VTVALVWGTCATVTGVAGGAPLDPSGGPGPGPGSGAAAVDPSTYSFITAPTDQLGVPGYPAGSELTPAGGIYTGYGEVDWRLGPSQRILGITPRTLGVDGRSPIFVMRLRSGSVRYAVTVLAAPVAGQPVDFVRVKMTNLGTRPAEAAWGSRLVYSGGAQLANGDYGFRFPPLIPQDPSWIDARSGRLLTRSGEVMEVVPAGGSGAPASGGVQYHRHLLAGASWELDYAIPFVPLAAGSSAVAPIVTATFSAELARELTAWHRRFSRAMVIGLPEAKVVDTFDASLADIMESRSPAPGGTGWIQTPNKLGYNAFFIRDASFIARALDLVGLHRAAAQDLEYFPAVQSPAGLFESQPDQLDGAGEALWAIGQHAAWPGQAAFARRMLGPVTRGVQWLAQACASDPDGLVPASDPDDNELASGHITGDDFMAADGLAAAVTLARVAGRPDLAAAWHTQLGRFLASLHTALAHAESLTGGWIPPTLEANGGQTWGNLWGSYPSAVALSPDAPAITATLAHVTASFRQGIATYQGELHDYLGFRVFETELQRGDSADVVAGLYAELAHTTATDGGFETDLVPGQSRKLVTNLAPHGWFAAEYVTLLRNMLVREAGASSVQIMSAVSADWLAPGDVISVQHASTTAGLVSYRLTSFAGGARLSWSDRLGPGVALRWTLPVVSGQRRTLILHGAHGTVTVHWRLRGPVPSFTRTVAQVLTDAGARR
jgi:hypothetical protein